MEKTLSIHTVSVEIRVVRVDGHKMTLATFRQIPEVDYSGAKYCGHKFLGWVQAAAPWPRGVFLEHDEKPLNAKGKWLLCIDENGTLNKAAWPELTDPPVPQLYMAT